MAKNILALLILSLQSILSNEQDFNEFKDRDFKSLPDLLAFIVSKSKLDKLKENLDLLKEALTTEQTRDSTELTALDSLKLFFEENEDWLNAYLENKVIADASTDEPTEAAEVTEVVTQNNPTHPENDLLKQMPLQKKSRKKRKLEAEPESVKENQSNASSAVKSPSINLWLGFKDAFQVEEYFYPSSQAQQNSFPLLTDVFKHERATNGFKYFFIQDRDYVGTSSAGILAISFYIDNQRKIWVIDLSGMLGREVLLRSQSPDKLAELIHAGEISFFQDWCIGRDQKIGGELLSNDEIFSFSKNIFILIALSFNLISNDNLPAFNRFAENCNTLKDLLNFIKEQVLKPNQIIRIMINTLYSGLTAPGKMRTPGEEDLIQSLLPLFKKYAEFLQQMLENINTYGCAIKAFGNSQAMFANTAGRRFSSIVSARLLANTGGDWLESDNEDMNNDSNGRRFDKK